MTTTPTFIEATVTCHTENCENRDIPIPVEMVIGGTVICGPCANEITDVTTN
jgi:hypothetical protein